VDAGDHFILIGQVIDHQSRDVQPLGYYRGNYFSIGLEESLVNAAGTNTSMAIGAVMERDQQILLVKSAKGGYRVPRAPAASNSLQGLVADLKSSGLSPELDYLYAVYRDSETGIHGIFYHGTVAGEPPDGMRFFDLQDIPLDQIPSAVERSMLARYREEFRHGSFGIYQGDETQGTVHHVSQRNPSKH